MPRSRRQRIRPRLRLHTLEDRVAPAIDNWLPAAGGSWTVNANWSLGAPPGANDDAVIPALNSGATVSLSSGTPLIHGLTIDAQGSLTLNGGSLTLGNNGTGSISGTLKILSSNNLTVQNGSTLNINNGASIFGQETNSTTFGIIVNGTLNTTSAQFTHSGPYGSSTITVNAGGHLTATNTLFDWSGVSLSTAVISAGNLAGNTFNSTVTTPTSLLPFFANPGNENISFKTIAISSTSLVSGTANLNLVGLDPSLELYTFPSGFTVGAGTTLAVGSGVPVFLPTGQLLRVDGTMSLAAGSNLQLSSAYNGGTQVVVNGLLTATSATISNPGNGYSTTLTVNSNGHFKATGTTITLSQLNLNATSIMVPGDFANNTFNVPLSLPYNFVPYLSAAGGGSDNVSFQEIDVLNGTLSSGTLHFDQIGLNQGNPKYVFPTGFIVGAGATLAVGNNVTLLVSTGQTLTVNGTMTLATGSTLALSSNYNGGTQVIVNGLLSATSAFINNPGSGYTTTLTVNSNGRLKATGTVFSLTQLNLAATSIFVPGDLANNTFNVPLFLPYNFVPYLSAAGGGSDNVSFQEIDVINGNLPSGTLRFDPLGLNQGFPKYVFPAGFTVGGGATLALGANVTLSLSTGQLLTVNGTMSLAAGSTLALSSNYNGGTQVVVNGLFSATSAFISNPGSNYTTTMTVNSGGRLKATGSTFTLTQLNLAATSIFNSGDLAGNTFNVPLFLPYNDVPLLSAAGGGSDNVFFQEIDILNGTQSTGTLNLAPIGNFGNPQYVFPAGFTIGANAKVAVGNNVTVVLSTGQLLTINGTMTLGAGSTLGLSSYYNGGTQVVVNGLLQATSAFITSPGSGYTTTLTVNSAGRLKATGTTVTLTQLTLNNGSILKTGDITGSTFNTTVSIPLIDAALLTNNLVFNKVIILPGSLSNGQVASLAPLGQTGLQEYDFTAATGNFTIQAGATLTIQPETRIVAVESNGTTFGLVVNGNLNIADATFTHSNSFGSSTIQAGLGGHITMTNSTMAWSNVKLNSGSSADAQFMSFTTKLTINSGTAINIYNNDFSNNGPDGVIAAGTSTATIDLSNNYWGSNPSAIPGMIQDHFDNTALPTINFTPYLTTPPFPYFNPSALNLNFSGVPNSQSFTPAGGTGPASNFAVVGSLPDGMSLSSGGVLSGTPTRVGSYTFTITADDFVGGTPFTAKELYWLVVKDPVLSFDTAPVLYSHVGASFNQAISVSGGVAPYSNFLVTAGALPNGLSLSTGGLISGTPTIDGIFDFTVTVQDNSTGLNAPYLTSQGFTIIIDDAPPNAGYVNDGLGIDIDFQASVSALSANWSSFTDPSSGIASYQWGVGTSPGGLDVLAFTNVGNSNSAQKSGLTLSTGTTYYIAVQAIDNSGNASGSAVSDGVVVDNLAPSPGSVNDGLGADIDVQASTTTISANWSGFGETASGIASYQWAIGLSPGGTNVQDYTDVGAATYATATGLSLSENSRYYVSVRAVDSVGNAGTAANSDGVTIVPVAPVIVSYSVDSGVAGDDITNDNTLTLSGTAVGLATVKVYDNGNATPLGQVVAASNGSWQFTTSALTDGVHAFTVTATNLSGNTSPMSAPLGVTVDTAKPGVTINQSTGQVDPTNLSPISFDVHFSKPVTNFGASSVSFSGSTVGGILIASVFGAGADYTVLVTGMTGTGNVVASVPVGVVTDVAGNANTASTSTDNSVSFDNVAPTVTISPAPGQPDPAFTAPVKFHVVFNKPVTGFDAADIDLLSSTVGGTLVASVTGSGTDYTISVTGMAGIGSVVAVIAPGAAVDAAGNGSAAPTGINSVNFNSSGQFQFSAANFNTTEGAGTVLITVSRINGSDGLVSVAYATSNGSATSGDYTATSGVLTWIDGDFADKTFSVTINPNDGLSEGDETIHLTLSSPSGGAILAAQSTSVLTIAKNSPLASGVPFTDADGDQVTLKLSGPGTLNYYLTDGKGPIAEIDLAGTDPLKSTLSVAVKKMGGDGRTQIDEIVETDGTGLKSLALAKADLVGGGININGFVGSLAVGAIPNGGDIALAGPPPKAGQTMKITAGVIGDGTDISIAGAPLGSLTAISVGAGSIVAPSVGTIIIKGKPKAGAIPAIPGDFKSNLTIAGTNLAPKVPALKLLHVAGAVSGSTITVGSGAGTNGDVGAITVGSFVNSTLFAGYTGPTDGSGTFNLPSTIGTFTVSGASKAFAHSYVIATNFNNVSLATVDPDNSGTKFGFLYRTNMKALKVKSTGFIFNPVGTPEQDMQPGDFYVKKV